MSGHVVKLRGLGSLRGIVERNIDGGSYLAFKGVPYARPPVGKLRFSDPVPPEPWTGIREASKFSAPCGQYDFLNRKFCGSDDCLYLNVYVPSTEQKTSRNLPVMVWLHGGGFLFGSGDNFLYGPDYLIKKDVIVVSINYRLGVLGFLNLEHRAAPGNQGLKDQVLALRWIQEHVEAFGGDKNNVTIFGESAGAASVHYLSLSPLAEGLFHKAIAQSATGFCPWASVLPNPKSCAVRLLQYLGKSYSGERETVDFLKTVDCAKLIEAQTKIQTREERAQLVFLFVPGADDAADVPFLPNFQFSLQNGSVKVPLILGYNDAEGIALVKVSGPSKPSSGAMDANLEGILHPHVTAALKRGKKSAVTDLQRAYFGEDSLDPEKSMMKSIQLLSDMHFVNGVHDLAEIQAKHREVPSYLYRFSFDNGRSPMKMLVNMAHVPGACHADELTYLFHPHGLSEIGYELPERGSKERTLIERMTQMWTDFARTGNPIPAESEFVKTTWKPIREANELHYLEINEELSPALNPDAAWRLAWNKLPNKL